MSITLLEAASAPVLDPQALDNSPPPQKSTKSKPQARVKIFFGIAVFLGPVLGILGVYSQFYIASPESPGVFLLVLGPMSSAASFAGFILAIAIYYSQNYRQSIEMANQLGTIEKLTKQHTQILTTRLGEVFYGFETIDIATAEGLAKNWIKSPNTTEFFYICRFSAVPFFWHDRGKSFAFQQSIPDTRAGRVPRISFFGPGENDFRNLAQAIATLVADGREEALKSNRLCNWRDEAIQLISKRDGQGKAGDRASLIETLTSTITDDYQDLVSRGGFRLRRDIPKELYASPFFINLVVRLLDSPNRYGSHYEMILFSDGNSTMADQWTEEQRALESLKEPRILHIRHPFFTAAVQSQLDSLRQHDATSGT